MYDGASDEEKGQDSQNFCTTLLLHLKRPASFFLKKAQIKKILSPFALPQADQRNQLPNFWNLNQVICLKGRLDLSCDLAAIFESLVTDELIPNSVENLSKGTW